MLHITQELTIAFELPPGTYSREIRDIIPTQPGWGMYFSLENVNESLVDAHLSTLSSDSENEAVVLHLEERRTAASKALAASLAIAAADLLDQKVLDYEHVWSGSDEISPSALQQQLTVPELQHTLNSALSEFVKRMNRSY
jgi:hypothetical protein